MISCFVTAVADVINVLNVIYATCGSFAIVTHMNHVFKRYIDRNRIAEKVRPQG